MKVGIIGAGTMGSGIAQAFAQSNGYEVFLCDINEEFAANGKNKIAKGLNGRVAKGKMPMCVQHCQAWCLYHGEVGELARKMDGKTRWALMVPQMV